MSLILEDSGTLEWLSIVLFSTVVLYCIVLYCIVTMRL